jgi:hypothetical protein
MPNQLDLTVVAIDKPDDVNLILGLRGWLSTSQGKHAWYDLYLDRRLSIYQHLCRHAMQRARKAQPSHRIGELTKGILCRRHVLDYPRVEPGGGDR